MKTRIILAALLAIVAGYSSAVRAQQSTNLVETLTLEQALNLALQNNRSVRNARLESEKANDKVAALRTRRLPGFKMTTLFSQPLSQFDTTFERGIFGTFPTIGDIPAENTIIQSSTSPTALVFSQATQPLSQLYRTNLQLRQLEASREISDAQVDAKEQGIVNEVKRAYYSILQTQGATRAAGDATKLYRELDRVTGEYVVQQVALKTDHLQVQTRLAQAEYEEMTLANLLATQKEQLNNLLGRNLNTEFNVADGLETTQVAMRETDLNQARERALANRPELREARLRIKQAKLDQRIKKSEYIPDVSLSVNYVSTFNYSNFLPRSVTSLGIQMEWEILDWGRRKRELAEKGRALTQAEISLADLENTVLLDVNNRYRRVQEAREAIRVAQLLQTHARSNVQLVAYKYRLDAVLLKDVLQAQATLADANYECQKAFLTFWTAKADFEKAMGEDK